MIERPDGVEIVEVEIEFNFLEFEYLEVDLAHVNKKDRSKLTVNEVAFLAKSIIHKLRLLPSGQKAFDDEMCSYFVRKGEVENKKYKLVFCVCSDRPTSIGVITLHRI